MKTIHYYLTTLFIGIVAMLGGSLYTDLIGRETNLGFTTIFLGALFVLVGGIGSIVLSVVK